MNRTSLLALIAALACLAAAPPPVRLYSGRPLAAWLADLDDADPLVREEAAEVLGHVGEARRAAERQLRKLLDHPNAPLRERAALALWRLTGDGRPAVRVLSASLAKMEGRSARPALSLLADLGAESAPAVDAILPFLDDNDRPVRELAARALASVGRPGLPALMRAFQSQEPRLRRNVVEVLVNHLSPLLSKAEVPTLRERLADDLPVRVNAARLLWALGQRDEAVLSALRDGVKSPDPSLASGVLDTLRSKEKTKALVPLLEVALAGKHVANRIAAARLHFEIQKDARRVLPAYLATIRGHNRDDWPLALEGLGDLKEEAQSAVPRLLEMLKIRDHHYFIYLSNNLIRIGPPCIPGLAAVLAEDTSEEQNAHSVAVTVLGALGKPAAAAVAPLLASKRPAVRSRAVRVLQAIGPEAKDVVPRIAALLDDPDEVIRDHAANALGGIGPAAKGAVPKLLELAAGKEQPLGISCLKALAKIGADSAKAVPHALTALKSPNAFIRAAGVELLAAADPRHKELAPALERLLKRPATAAAALRVVGRLGDEAAGLIPAVVAVLKDDPEARQQAVEALAAIGPAARGATPALLETLQISHTGLRQAVMTALHSVEADPKDTVPMLTGISGINAPHLAIQATAMLGEYGPKAAAAYPTLLGLLRDASRQPSVRIQAGLSLVQIDPDRSRREIRADLRQLLTLAGVDCIAVRALLMLDPDDKEAVVAAEAALASPDLDVRTNAAHQLSLLGAKGRRFLPAIQAMLRDPHPYTPSLAAVAVWRVTGEKKEAHAVLRALLEDKGRPNVSIVAAIYAGKMGADGKELLPLMKALPWRHSENRSQIEEAIRAVERAVARKAARSKNDNIGRITP